MFSPGILAHPSTAPRDPGEKTQAPGATLCTAVGWWLQATSDFPISVLQLHSREHLSPKLTYCISGHFLICWHLGLIGHSKLITIELYWLEKREIPRLGDREVTQRQRWGSKKGSENHRWQKQNVCLTDLLKLLFLGRDYIAAEAAEWTSGHWRLASWSHHSNPNFLSCDFSSKPQWPSEGHWISSAFFTHMTTLFSSSYASCLKNASSPETLENLTSLVSYPLLPENFDPSSTAFLGLPVDAIVPWDTISVNWIHGSTSCA